jgi:hypothetical protein
MLRHGGLDNSFWVDPRLTRTYLSNMSPTRALKDETPKEDRTRTESSTVHLGMFASDADVHFLKQTRSKLDS